MSRLSFLRTSPLRDYCCWSPLFPDQHHLPLPDIWLRTIWLLETPCSSQKNYFEFLWHLLQAVVYLCNTFLCTLLIHNNTILSLKSNMPFKYNWRNKLVEISTFTCILPGLEVQLHSQPREGDGGSSMATIPRLWRTNKQNNGLIAVLCICS